jgi:hypothetical protein
MGQTVRRGPEAGRLAMLNREDRFCSIGGKLKFGPFELSSRERVLRHEGVVLPLGRRSLDGRAPLLKRGELAGPHGGHSQGAWRASIWQQI